MPTSIGAGNDEPGGKTWLVSVVINNYNYKTYVANAIESVLRQTWRHVECIVVDDGSTDGSQEVIAGFEPAVIKICKDNGGQTSAVREGVKASRGDLVVLLDSDDVLYPTCCQALAEAWDGEATLVQYGLDIVARDASMIGRYPIKPFLRADQADYAKRWGELPSSPTSGNAFRRDLLDECLALVSDTEIAFVDGFFICSAAISGSVIVLNESLGRYLVHGQNASPSARQNLVTIASQVRVNIQQRAAFCKMIERRCGFRPNVRSLLAPYHWRAIAFIKYAHLNAEAFPEFTIGECRWRGIAKFWIFPDLTLIARLKNVAVLLLLPFLPRSIIMRKVPIPDPALG